MPTNRLTELAIRNAKCGSKRKKLSDGGSMYLELHPNGGKYWRMNYQFQKKEKTLALGVWPQTSLVEARHKRDEAKIAGMTPEGFNFIGRFEVSPPYIFIPTCLLGY